MIYSDTNKIKAMLNAGKSHDEIIQAMSRNYTPEQVAVFLPKPKKTRKKVIIPSTDIDTGPNSQLVLRASANQIAIGFHNPK